MRFRSSTCRCSVKRRDEAPAAVRDREVQVDVIEVQAAVAAGQRVLQRLTKAV
jgi:hypothetical protein